MTKYELVKTVSINAKVDEETANKVIEETFQTIANVLQVGDRIKIPLFGVFHTKIRNPRKHVNPQTKEVKILPAKKIIVFAPAKALKDKVETHVYWRKCDG